MKLISIAIVILSITFSDMSLSIAYSSGGYTIIKETSNERLSKANLTVMLSEKIDIHALGDIAHFLRGSRKQYDRLWIAYMLPGMLPNAGAWATSHFTPDLELRILGSTIEEEMALRNISALDERNIVGKWMDNRPYVKSLMVIENKGDFLVLTTSFSDGSSMDEKVVKTSVGGKQRYDMVESDDPAFFVIERNGNLGMYSPNGKFGEATKVK
jgi:hypothetical protein